MQHCGVHLLHSLMLEKQETEAKYYATYKHLQIIFFWTWVCVLKVSSIQLNVILCHLKLFFGNLHLSNWVLPIRSPLVYWKWPLKISYLLASAVGDLWLTNPCLCGFPSEKWTYTSIMKKSWYTSDSTSSGCYRYYRHCYYYYYYNASEGRRTILGSCLTVNEVCRWKDM